MKNDLAKALNGVLLLQQWQNQLVQSALRQIQATRKKRPGRTGALAADRKSNASRKKLMQT